MSEVMDRPVAKTIRRVGRTDLDELRPFLTSRLSEKYKTATEPQIAGYLYSCLDNNEFLFMRSGDAVALARLGRRALRPPHVEEVFVLSLVNDSVTAALLYEPIIRWGRTQGAKELIVDIFTDVPHYEVKKLYGAITVRNVRSLGL